MRTLLIFRGLAKGRRQSLIDDIKSSRDHRNVKQIDTPAPKIKLTKNQMKDLSTRAFNDFKMEISKGTKMIIINNANLKKYHYFQYLDHAQRNGYLVGVVLVPWNDMTNRELAIDSGNTTPEKVFDRFRKTYEWEL